MNDLGSPGGTVVKNPPANAGDTGSNLGPGGVAPARCNQRKPMRSNKDPMQPKINK